MSKQIIGRTLKAMGIAAVIVVATGCANTAEIEEANNTAERALQMAEQAMRAAEAASNKADAAMSKAEESQSCCQDAHRKIDEAFKRSQYK